MAAPPAKRQREEPEASSATQGSAGGPAGQETDPDQLGDVIHAAGVDLREEESLLSSGLVNEPGGLAGSRLLHAPRDCDQDHMLLNYGSVRRHVSQICADAGLRLVGEDVAAQPTTNGLNQDPVSLLSASCEEWLSEILETAAAFSRHRRLSLNPQSMTELNPVGRALRQLIQKDKDNEQKHKSMKMQLGIGPEFGDNAGGSGGGDGASGVDKEKENEENMQRAANDTARMMTAAVGRKKKFAWMSEGSSGSASRLTGSRRSAADPNKFKEVKEENGIVVRDLMPALERKHMGVRKTLMKGYARLKN